MWQTNLIKLDCAVCDHHNTTEAVMQRQNNNFRRQFSDEECITVYLWGISQRRFEQRTIYEYTKNHLMEWFPDLPSYTAFSKRLNALAPVFQTLAECWLAVIAAAEPETTVSIVDSCPIVLAKGARSRHAKVASEPCEKSYNSSRKKWYYGVKLHAFVARHAGHLPTPLALMASGAALHDLTAAKQIMQDNQPLSPGALYADKAYIDATWAQLLEQNHSIRILAPRKRRKDDPIRSGDAFSAFVSSVRQPIECFFNWLNRLTNIQTASTVRSLTGLLLHIFGRIAATLVSQIFNS